MSQKLAYAIIDTKALAHNARVIKRFAKGIQVVPVIKADAYGHGMIKVAQALNGQGIKWFGVSDLNEGALLRKVGFRHRILLFENPLKKSLPGIIKNNLTPIINSYETALDLSCMLKKPFFIHVKVDTGMGRFGIREDLALQEILRINELPNIRIEGLCTHFPSAENDRAFTLKQIQKIKRLSHELKSYGIAVPLVHTANSMGLANYRLAGNMARAGLLFYGLYPLPKLKTKLKLKPVMRVVAHVVFIKLLKKGESVSYGRTYVAKKNMKIAAVSIGYKDGYLRSLSNRSFVMIRRKKCPVLGRVTMDQIMVDVTKLKNAREGDVVTILGDEITAEDLAQWAGTINYEIVCSFGFSLEKSYY